METSNELAHYVEKKMVLNISDYPGYKYFELSSGKFSTEFVTIWELFDDKEYLKKFVISLSDIAKKIRENFSTFFNTIIVSTNTERELAKHLLPILNEDIYSQPVRILNFEDYPAVDQIREFENRKNQNILILTDVIASGTLVKKIAKFAIRMEANVSAILAVCITNTELASRKKVQIDDIEVPIKTLTEYNIKYFQNITGVAPNEIKKINPITVLPDESIKQPFFKKPLINQKDAFIHFSQSCALNYGYYKFEGSYFSTAINIYNLLNSNIEISSKIWKSIKAIIAENDVILTSYRKEDLDFLFFVQEHLKAEGLSLPAIITLKRETRDSQYLYFTIRADQKKALIKKKVLLLLSTVLMAEKLRNISSLLISLPVQTITALCLINRMGPYATSFISGINKLFAFNKTSSSLSANISFKFIPIYNLKDFDSLDLEKINFAIEDLYKRYSAFTRVSYFTSFFLKYREHFKPTTELVPIITKTIEAKKKLEIIDQTGKKIKLFIEDEVSLICALNYHTSATRDYKLLFDQINSVHFANPKNVFFHFLRIILSDINFLRSTLMIDELFDTLINKITYLRVDRRKFENRILEAVQNNDVINLDMREKFDDYYNQEINLFLCLAILSNYEEISDKISSLSLTKFVLGMDFFENYESHPLSFKILFEDTLPFFCLSLFLMSYKNPRVLKHEIKQQLGTAKKQIESINNQLEKLGSQSGLGYTKIVKLEKNIITSNIDLLYKEIGEYDFRKNFQTIMFLQEKICKERVHHNAISETFNFLKNKFFEDFNKNKNKNEILILSQSNYEHLKLALSSISVLQTIAEAARKFFHFHVGIFDKQQRYITKKDHPGLAMNVYDFEKRLSQIVESRQLNLLDLQNIDELYRQIFTNDILDKQSVIYSSLYQYVCSPIHIVGQAIDEVISQKKKDESFVWLNQLKIQKKIIDKKIAELEKHTDNYFAIKSDSQKNIILDKVMKNNFTCLCDTMVLRLTIINLLSNLRHAKVKDASFKFSVSFEKNHHSPKDVIDNKYISILFKVEGTKNFLSNEIINSKSTTISHQATQILNLGGNIFSNDSNTISINLISRENYLPWYLVYNKE